MSYKAQVISLTKIDGKEAVKAVVSFVDDNNNAIQREFVFGLGFSAEQLKEQIRYKVQQLENLDAEISKIPQDVDIDFSKNQTQVESEDLINKVNKMIRIKSLIDLGIISETDVTKLDTLKAEIKALYKKLEG